MGFPNTALATALALDSQDELAEFRQRFVFADPNLIYLDGNSLGRLPKASLERMRQVVEYEWGQRLVRGWNEGWLGAPSALGAKIAQLIGAHPDEVLVTEATSINLFKLAVAALRAAAPGRTRILSDEFNFPSDLYILQGIIDLFGDRHQLDLIPSADGLVIAPEAVQSALRTDTALVCLTHVAFKSAFRYDMAQVTAQAHQAGALALWDLSHSTGVVPVELNAWDVDLAVGCTYKYLNGGPGAPAFLYVRRDLQERLLQPMWGWFAGRNPFAFHLDFTPAGGMARFQVGTPPMLSTLAIEPALDLTLEAGVERLRRKSVLQTEYLIYLAGQWLLPLGFQLGSPRLAELRGSHVSLRHPEGYRITRALIEGPALRVIPDFRTPDNLRLGVAPIYNSFVEIHQALERLRVIAAERIYEQYPVEHLAVT